MSGPAWFLVGSGVVAILLATVVALITVVLYRAPSAAPISTPMLIIKAGVAFGGTLTLIFLAAQATQPFWQRLLHL
ncbi:hypothetical protein ACIGDI_40120 [Streptomyces sp. NPDC085900]|uniref:hypothetical protein n=1 Tax=Streptomyces sp. NPDC085900 TaxID=3365737 RepID=UPI0037D0DE4F